jgi:uncharacterized membrane protein YhaH (DUF805 family)
MSTNEYLERIDSAELVRRINNGMLSEPEIVAAKEILSRRKPPEPEKAKSDSLLFSFDGRISRKTYWTVLMPINLVTIALSMFIRSNSTDGAALIFSSILLVFLCWPLLALQCKRWHDVNKSGWWSCIAVVPIIGGLYALTQNGFKKGTEGENQFGEDPLASTES